MAVSNFVNNGGYFLGRLDNCVFLLSEDATKVVLSDDGAYIQSLGAAPTIITAYQVELEDGEELDERYLFSHQVSFTITGYADYSFFQNKFFYVLVRDADTKTLWLVNPMLPCKVEYTYTLDSTGSHTRFSMLTLSNHPMLRVYGDDLTPVPLECKYQNELPIKLELNEKNYVFKSGNTISYTNDGYKEVAFNKNSLQYQEVFNGTNLTLNIGFGIRLDSTQSGWHINLIEFPNNKYSAIITTNNNAKISVGFGNGFSPDYQIEGGSSNGDQNNISIVLTEQADGGDASGRFDDGSGGGGQVVPSTAKTWVFTSEYDGYECVSNSVAMYLLQKEVDALGNPTGRYKAKEGYQSQFDFLNIVGTFSETVTFTSSSCNVFTPSTGGTLPSSINLREGECKDYTFSSSCDWHISSITNQYLRVTPSSGFAGTLYTITVCYPMFRWIVSGYTCSGTSKYNQELRQYSYDSGSTWSSTTETRTGQLVEEESEDCGYIPPEPTDECEITAVELNPSSSILTDGTASTVVTISSTGECETPITWTAYKMISGDGGSWIPSITVKFSGESGDNLTVNSVGRYDVFSDYDNSKYATFNVTEPAPSVVFGMCASGNQSTAVVNVGYDYTTGTSKVCDDSPIECGMVYTATSDADVDVRMTFYYEFTDAQLVKISNLSIGGVAIGDAQIGQQYYATLTNGQETALAYFTCYNGRIEEYAPNWANFTTQMDGTMVLSNGEVVDLNTSLWGYRS